MTDAIIAAEETFEHTQVVETKTSLVVRQLEPDLFIFRRSFDATTVSSKGTFKVARAVPAPVASVDGAVDAKNKAKMLKGLPFTTKNLIVMSPELREIFRTEGFPRAWDHPTYKAEMGKGGARSIYTSIVDNGASLDDLVEFNHSCHMLLDRHGQPLPVGIYMDYIQARMHDGFYDIEKAAEILLARDDVRVICHGGVNGSSWKTDEPDKELRAAETVEQAIIRVPSYNADHSRSRFLAVIWQPSAEDYAKMWGWCTRDPKNVKYASTNMKEAVFELDLMGLRAGGAAKGDSFHWYPPERPRHGCDCED